MAAWSAICQCPIQIAVILNVFAPIGPKALAIGSCYNVANPPPFGFGGDKSPAEITLDTDERDVNCAHRETIKSRHACQSVGSLSPSIFL